MRNGGFQMKAAGDGNGDYFIVVRRKNGGKLADAFRVAARSEANKELSADAKDITTFESAGKRNVFQLSKSGERPRKRWRFTAAGLRSERQDHRQFIEDDGGIFNKDGVWEIGFGGKRDNAGAQLAEERLISVVLLLRGGQINAFAVDEGKLAIDDGWANATCDSGEHGKQRSLHEILLRRGPRVYRLAVEIEGGANRMAIGRGIGGGLLAGVLVFGGLNAAAASAADDKKAVAVDEIFVDLTKAGSPGCALGVYRDGKMVYSKGYGLANLEENVPVTPQSVFDIGSTSKQFTAASILLLEKQGKLSINDDVRKYIPELPDYGEKITIAHLLNHTSGLRDYLTLMDLAGINTDGVTTDEDALQIIFRQKALNFAPGSDWLYSNTGFFLLSVIVKRVSGKTLREFAAEDIFTPLTVSHGGSWGGYRAELLRFPEQHFSVACLCNLGSARPSNRARRVADVYLASLMKPKEANKEPEKEHEKVQTPVSLTAEQLKSYQGDYWSDELGVAYRLGIVDGKLKMIALLDAAGSAHTGNLPPIAFEPAAADKFG